MKYTPYALAFLLALPTALNAQDRGEKATQPSRLRRELAPRPYTFDDYIADLKRSARKDQPKPVNPVTEEEAKVAANKYKDYKPLNPIVVEW
ncbi:MAG TPA: hypothetical protein VKH64_06950 [Candidatus Binatia bacterium]|nr:hypothetical protein [Candidatus Binatia bacterium]